ncbi:unnamed protein product [Rhizophagus irregularis]|uniref:Uncharacterized protein n=1 Tax=Rhizophagus irregularis TaxID=588596 RepID=A0A915ZDU3_9GLOM|nr:unnamed protein product [Rhizophagus irregularis]
MSSSLSYFYPESITECQRFWVYLRKLNFLNPMETKTDFKSLGGESKLRKILADEFNIIRIDILHKVESLLEQMSESIRKQCYGIGSKKKSELLAILQEVRNLQSIDSELDDIDVV